MSQIKVIRLLKKNPETYLTAKEISNILKLNIQTISKTLNQLEKYGEVRMKTITSAGVAGYTKLYGFMKKDGDFEKVVNKFKMYQQDNQFNMSSPDVIRQFMTITELRKIRRLLENERNK